jgi:hypothetical protein
VATVQDHLVTVRERGRFLWQAVCSCGESSPIFKVAGIAHGWEDEHLRAVQQGRRR